MICSAASRAWASVSATTKATASPTWRTRSVHRIGRSLWTPFEPSRFSIGIMQGRPLPAPAATRSAPVITASTPGAALAASASIAPIRACASGERSTQP